MESLYTEGYQEDRDKKESNMSIHPNRRLKHSDCIMNRIVLTSCDSRVLAMLDNSLFDHTAFPKLQIVSLLLFRTNGQDGVEFF